jgi:hypothetical protein
MADSISGSEPREGRFTIGGRRSNSTGEGEKSFLLDSQQSRLDSSRITTRLQESGGSLFSVWKIIMSQAKTILPHRPNLGSSR